MAEAAADLDYSDYFDDNLDEIIINFVPDDLVKLINAGTHPGLDFINTEQGSSEDNTSTSLPKLNLLLTNEEVRDQTTQLWIRAIHCIDNDLSYFISDDVTVKKRKEALQKVKDSIQSNMDLYQIITSNLYDIVNACESHTLLSEGRKSMWREFYNYLSSNQNSSWSIVKNVSGVENFDLLKFKLSSKLVELLFTENVDVAVSVDDSDATSEPSKIDDREQNILKYVSGFVVFSLTKKYSLLDNEVHTKFVKVLDTWSLKNANQAVWFEFKDKWLNLVNRGGLVDVNNDCFLFFRSIEYTVRKVFNVNILKDYMGQNLKEVLKIKILKNRHVLYCWDKLVEGDLLSLSEKEHFFKRVIIYWVDIRGRAFVRAWVDGLRSQCKVSNKGEHSLRKQLNITKSK